MKKLLPVVMSVVLSCLLASAVSAANSKEPLQGKKRLLQTSINATIVISSMKEAMPRLQEIVAKTGAVAININTDSNNTSGSASLQIDADKVPLLMKSLHELGDVEAQNMSTSDYTQTWEEYSTKLKAYTALARTSPDRIFSSINVPEEQKMAIFAEYQNMIKNQMQSCRSTLQNYEHYGEYVQVSLQLKRADSRNANQPVTVVNAGQPPAMAEKKSDNSLLMLLYMAVFVNFVILFLLYRKISRTPFGSQERIG